MEEYNAVRSAIHVLATIANLEHALVDYLRDASAKRLNGASIPTKERMLRRSIEIDDRYTDLGRAIDDLVSLDVSDAPKCLGS